MIDIEEAFHDGMEVLGAVLCLIAKYIIIAVFAPLWIPCWLIGKVTDL